MEDIKSAITDDLISRFPELQKIFWMQLADFCTKYPENKLRAIYDQVCKTGFYGKPPDISLFYKAAAAIKVQEIEKKQGDKPFMVYECTVCRSVYDIKSRGCPTCHAMTPTSIATREKADQFIHLQEDCFECRFNQNPLSANGPVCLEYGKGSKIPDCAKCECVDCCKEKSDIVALGEQKWREAIIPEYFKDKMKGDVK